MNCIQRIYLILLTTLKATKATMKNTKLPLNYNNADICSIILLTKLPRAITILLKVSIIKNLIKLLKNKSRVAFTKEIPISSHALNT